MGANNQSIKNLGITNASAKRQKPDLAIAQASPSAQVHNGVVIGFSSLEGYTVELLDPNNQLSGVTFTGVGVTNPSLTFAVNDRVLVMLNATKTDIRIVSSAGGGSLGAVSLQLANRFFSS
jgi:hypothetical protein